MGGMGWRDATRFRMPDDRRRGPDASRSADGVDPQLPPDVTAIVEHTAIVKAMLVDCENHRLELFGSLRAAERGWLQRNSAVTEVMSVLVATDKNSEVSHGFLEHYSAVYHQLLNQLTEPAPGNTSCEQFP